MGAASRTASTSLHQRHFTFQCVRADFKNVSIVGHYIKDRTKNAQEREKEEQYRRRMGASITDPNACSLAILSSCDRL
eukprot:scaffold4743_cov22-Tisochrysis_lutea.AAC.1